MKTEELEKFLNLNDTTLSNIEGGNLSAGEVGNAFGICATAGAIIGGVPLVLYRERLVEQY